MHQLGGGDGWATFNQGQYVCSAIKTHTHTLFNV